MRYTLKVETRPVICMSRRIIHRPKPNTIYANESGTG